MCVFIQIVYVLCVYTAKIVGAGKQESYIQYVCVCVCILYRFIYPGGDLNLNTHRLMGTRVTVGT